MPHRYLGLAAVLGAMALIGAGCFPKRAAVDANVSVNVNAPSFACTLEAKRCPDGTSVGRVPPDCEFAPCPPSVCADDVRTCPDGSQVTRMPPTCIFPNCPGEDVVCPQDTYLCVLDGTYVSRVPPDCEFAPCRPVPGPVCEDKCGNGSCEAVTCQAVGCPCAENPTSCPQDCKVER